MFKMTPFRRKKVDKSFPVKVITFDSELEFKLEVGVRSFKSNRVYFYAMQRVPSAVMVN